MINNAADTYQVYLQSDGDSSHIGTPTLMFADKGGNPFTSTFGFRNGAASNDLTTINFGSASATSVVNFDDIYVDKAAQNLANPAVPEPAAIGLFVVGGAIVALRRRSQSASA